nr:DUF2793 domain-containing protein [Hyphomonas sp. Mor2]
MDFSTKLTLPYLLPNQTQKHVTMNESLRRLDALVQLSVISATLASPPETPVDGDRYIVGASSEGDWTGADGQVAAYQDGAWLFYPPQTGWMAWMEDTAQLMVFDGAAWTQATASEETSDPDMLGINTSPDAYNRLAVRSAASLFTHEGAGHQVKINKAGESDTASLLFQSNWSGRAEIGLAGSDDFLLKVSPDGQTFAPALLVRASTGHVGIGTWSPTARLHVDGALRLACAPAAELPDAATVGAGGLMFVERAGGAVELVYSDGVVWRLVGTGASLSQGL